MKLHIYVDGSGPPESKFGYFVEETKRSSLKRMEGLTNNESEYHAIIEVLKDPEIHPSDEITIYSDSNLVINQINHEFAINNESLRKLAMEVWSITKDRKVNFEWVPRKANRAGKMLGS